MGQEIHHGDAHRPTPEMGSNHSPLGNHTDRTGPAAGRPAESRNIFHAPTTPLDNSNRHQREVAGPLDPKGFEQRAPLDRLPAPGDTTRAGGPGSNVSDILARPYRGGGPPETQETQRSGNRPGFPPALPQEGRGDKLPVTPAHSDLARSNPAERVPLSSPPERVSPRTIDKTGGPENTAEPKITNRTGGETSGTATQPQEVIAESRVRNMEDTPPLTQRGYDSSQEQAAVQKVADLLGAGNGDRATTLVELAKANNFDLLDVGNWLKSGLPSEQVEHILSNPTLPSIALSGTRLEHFEALSQSYPSLDQNFLSYLLSIQPQGTFLTHTQIEGTLAITQRINHFQTPGWEENNLVREIAVLHQANIPGTEKLVYDLFNGNYTGTDYLGSRFQLTWVNAHLGQIAAIEDFRPNGTKGVDVLLKDGTFVDTKSVQHLSLPSLQSQVDAYARDFPNLQGHTLRFVLERSVTTSSPASIKKLEGRLQAYAQQKNHPFTVDVSTYP